MSIWTQRATLLFTLILLVAYNVTPDAEIWDAIGLLLFLLMVVVGCPLACMLIAEEDARVRQAERDRPINVRVVECPNCKKEH